MKTKQTNGQKLTKKLIYKEIHVQDKRLMVLYKAKLIFLSITEKYYKMTTSCYAGGRNLTQPLMVF